MNKRYGIWLYSLQTYHDTIGLWGKTDTNTQPTNIEVLDYHKGYRNASGVNWEFSTNKSSLIVKPGEQIYRIRNGTDILSLQDYFQIIVAPYQGYWRFNFSSTDVTLQYDENYHGNGYIPKNQKQDINFYRATSEGVWNYSAQFSTLKRSVDNVYEIDATAVKNQKGDLYLLPIDDYEILFFTAEGERIFIDYIEDWRIYTNNGIYQPTLILKFPDYTINELWNNFYIRIQ